MRTKLLAPAALAALAVTAAAPSARADASAWMFFGAGGMVWKPGNGGETLLPKIPNVVDGNGIVTIEAGAGTSPDGRFILGGLFRIQPVFGNGTDIAALMRFCTHDFQAGSWGVAVDAGVFARFWGIYTGGFAGTISLGMPLGFTISLETEIGGNNTIGLGAVAGIDVLRLTVYRQALLKWWDNPSPGWKVPPRATLSF